MRPRSAVAKNIVGPPGIPPSPLQALRDALAAAMADPEFAGEMQRYTGIQNAFIDGAASQQLVADLADGFEANKDKIDPLLQKIHEKYVR